jgi:hypothetical protein
MIHVMEVVLNPPWHDAPFLTNHLLVSLFVQIWSLCRSFRKISSRTEVIKGRIPLLGTVAKVYEAKRD